MSHWVLLRGLAREARHWGDFAAALQARTAASTVIALDLPGNGYRHAEPSPVTVAAMADAYRAVLRERGLSPPYTLFALSLGGMAASAWATRHPQEIEAAVLVNTSMRGFGRWHERLRPRNYLRLTAMLLAGGGDWYERGVLQTTTRHPVADVDELLMRWRAYSRSAPVTAVNVLRQLAAAASFQAPPVAPAARLLVLAAARDGLVDPRCSILLARAWHADLAIHPTAGHDLPLDDPDWVLREVGTWCKHAGLRDAAGASVGAAE